MTAQSDDLIRDTVDLHYHSGPSPFPRRLDPVESAKHYDEHGFPGGNALVLATSG